MGHLERLVMVVDLMLTGVYVGLCGGGGLTASKCVWVSWNGIVMVVDFRLSGVCLGLCGGGGWQVCVHL